MSKKELTPREKRVLEIHLSSYAAHKDFTAQEWLEANEEVRNSEKLKARLRDRHVKF